MKIIYIYDKNLKFITGIYIENERKFADNPKEHYPDWEKEMFASLERYNNPILENGDLREKTREELILLDSKLELLQAGEYVEKGKIKLVEAPDNLIKKKWNVENRTWKEGATLKELENLFMDKIQEYMDKKAKTYGFDNVVTASTYLDSKVERFKNDSRTLLDWRDSMWDKAYTILENVLQGKRDIPILEKLFEELPQLEDGGR